MANWAWVYVANLRGATGPQGPAGTGYKGTLPNGTDLNSLTVQSGSGFYHLSALNTYTNLPPGFSGAGQVEVSVTGASSGEQRVVRYGFPETYRRSIKNYFSTPKTWTDWELEKDRIIDVPSGANLDDYRSTGRFMVQNTTIATSLTGGWPTQIPRGPVYFEVEATVAGIVFQQMYSYGASNTALSRATVALDTVPFPFGPWKDLGAASAVTDPSNAGLANAVRQDDFSFRRGGAKKLPFGAGAVALRFDHGLNNFDSIVRPLLEARNLKYLLALNSRGWTTAENNLVTASMVDAWVAGGLAKIGNHGAHHNDATTLAALQDVIVTGLAELKAQLPSASIDGWFVPGVGGTNYSGFNGGTTPEAFYNTDAGRLILENHAVSSGAFPNTSQRVLDGRVRQGQYHFTMDTSTVSAITAQIDAAITNRTGLQLMCHPSLLNTGGNITTADLTTVLDYLVTKQTAGDLVVLDPYELLLADAR